MARASGSVTMCAMDLPPDTVVRALVQRYGRVIAAFGREFGERPLVLPTSEFFPDKFLPDEKSVKRLVKRMLKHAGMEDIPVSATLHATEDDHEHGGSCGSGGCGTGACHDEGNKETASRLVDEGDGWTLNFTFAELKHPVALTCTIARSLAYVFLTETRREDEPIDQPVELTVDLAAVALGFGELLLEGSHIYQKSCGGPSVGKVTALGPIELAIPTALFVAQRGHSFKGALAELPATQKEALREARALVDSNPAVVEMLKKDPERVARGDFELGEAKPLLVRLFGKKKKREDDMNLEELEAMLAASPLPSKAKPKVRDPKRDELKALVDEALTESRSEAE